MTKLKTAPADAVSEGAALVAQLKADIAALEIEISTAESERDAKALELKDEEFEALVFKNERTKRSLLRLHKQLEAAQKAHAVAEAREERDRHRALYAEGQKASAEAERLAGEYATHANAIVEILRKIEKLREPIDAANTNLPDDERTIDAHPLEIYRGIELPAATKDGQRFWWRPDYYGYDPLNPPPAPKFVPRVRMDLMPSPPATPSIQRQVETGPRRFTMPACEWPGAAR